jgi:ribonucleoside-diphosphate reductase alpha chain
MTKAQSRPKILEGQTHKVATGCGNLYVTVNSDNGKPFEVFAKLGKAGGCSACTTEALTRVISVGLRAGVDIAEYHHMLVNIGCISPTFSEGVKINSCPDAIAQVLKEYIPEEK